MSDDIEIRRRRAIFRAEHRGCKEMDIMLGGYAKAHIGEMDGTRLANFERLLAIPDPDLQRWLFSGGGPDENDLSALVDEVRDFHGLKLKD